MMKSRFGDLSCSRTTSYPHDAISCRSASPLPASGSTTSMRRDDNDIIWKFSMNPHTHSCVQLIEVCLEAQRAFRRKISICHLTYFIFHLGSPGSSEMKNDI